MRNSGLAWVVLVVTVVATFFAWRFTKTSVDNTAEQEYLNVVRDSNDAISSRMLDYNIALDSAVGLLRSSDAPITRTGWKTFTDSLQLQTQFRGIQALGYAVIVPPEKKLDFEKSVRAEAFRISLFDRPVIEIPTRRSFTSNRLITGISGHSGSTCIPNRPAEKR